MPLQHCISLTYYKYNHPSCFDLRAHLFFVFYDPTRDALNDVSTQLLKSNALTSLLRKQKNIPG